MHSFEQKHKYFGFFLLFLEYLQKTSHIFSEPNKAHLSAPSGTNKIQTQAYTLYVLKQQIIPFLSLLFLSSVSSFRLLHLSFALYLLSFLHSFIYFC